MSRYNAATELVDRHVAEGRGDRIAYRDEHGSVLATYAGLARLVDATAHALARVGIEPEQRVLMVMLDGIDFVATFLGAMKLGAVPVPVSTMLKPHDYAYYVADSRARLLVVSDALEKVVDGGGRPPTLRRTITTKELAALVDAEKERGPFPAAATSRDDIAFWLYSSGSTGSPKGAMHLHSHLLETANLYARAVLGITPDDVVYSAAKLFFAYGLGNALTFPLSVGACAVLCPDRPTPATVARVMRQAKPTIFCGVPTLFASLLADQDVQANGLSPALRISTSAGEGLPRHIGESWRERFGSDILDGIGSTEMLHIFLSNRPGDVRYGTTGKPVAGYTLRLVGDDGGDVADGEEGALWVNGPTAAVAYWNQREKSLVTFHGPWTRTGDSYTRDKDGYYTYSGRTDDMLKVGGIWVSPFEVESALCAHPAVLEAAVIGEPDPDGLVKPKAFVVLKEGATATADDLKIFVKEKLAPYKYPRWIEFLTELPKTATGKIQRYKLRGA